MFSSLAITDLEEFQFGRCPKPVRCRRGVEIGAGTVIPELNFTLPPIDIQPGTWPEIRRQYTEMIEGVCRRAAELEVPALLVEFETLPEMTVRPQWGLDITRLLADTLDRYHERQGLKCALRLTPNDTRELARPPLMHRGKYWEAMLRMFNSAGEAGADLIGIESTGGKEVSDEAILNADLHSLLFALGVLAPRDMVVLWKEIVAACSRSGLVASGDTACAFGNTAMTLADQGLLPKVFAAVVRVAAVPRSLIAYEAGATGPSKDCAYEGPYMKAIAGVPISMEGRTAACAHLSHVGNIAQTVCDCWSNESVQNVRLLSAFAPIVSLEQLVYDCRLLNTAAANGTESARMLRDWLTSSDASLDPQAWVLRPDVVLRLAGTIIDEKTPYARTRRAILETMSELRRAHQAGELRIPEREIPWLTQMEKQAALLPDREEALIEQMMGSPLATKFLPEEYGLS